MTVLDIVAPVFLLAGMGFAWVRLGFEYRTEFVTRLATSVAVPCLIFTALMRMQIDGRALGMVAAAAVAAYGAVAVVAAVAVWLSGLDRRTFLAPLIFGNTGNVGLPLALLGFGETGLGYAVAIFAVSAVLTFTFGVWLVAGQGSAARVLREPMVWAALLGALFLAQGWQVPRALGNTLDLLGQMAIPLMLLTLGVAVARLSVRRFGPLVWLALAKLGLCIAVAAGIGRMFGLDATAFAVLVLQLSTPVAVTSYVLAEKYGADAQVVAGLVVTSTLVAVASLPAVLAWLI